MFRILIVLLIAAIQDDAARLKEAREIQVARSVELHARYTGRLPRTLDDLVRRPADLSASVCWPDGGFWLGAAAPKDVAYTADATGFTVGTFKGTKPPVSPVGAPTDRLKKFFTAKVHLHLLKAAAQGYVKAYGSSPKSPQDLVSKPEGVGRWPEGGWIGSLPSDPWGEAYFIRAGAAFSVGVAKPKGRMLRSGDLTAEERTGLEAASVPSLSAAESKELAALMDRLGADTLAEREEATRGIIALGQGVLAAVAERQTKAKDPEIASRLGVIQDQLRSVSKSWEAEMRGLRYSLTGTGADPGRIPKNERTASTTLKTITTAQADFRSNDRDGNREMDFYARDVAGLYALKPAMGVEREAKAGKAGEMVIRLIEPVAAKADTTEDRWEYPILGVSEPEARSGYFFAALKYGESGGQVKAYHEGSGRNSDQFGFVAYPAEYGVTGRRTYIVNEDNTIWSKDLGGDEVDIFPENPGAAGWQRAD